MLAGNLVMGNVDAETVFVFKKQLMTSSNKMMEGLVGVLSTVHKIEEMDV